MTLPQALRLIRARRRREVKLTAYLDRMLADGAAMLEAANIVADGQRRADRDLEQKSEGQL